jgi:hypothetical protein
MKNIVILVGGANTGKTQFYNEYTQVQAKPPTIKSTPNIAMFTQPSMVLVDTPGYVNFRNKFEYSWQGIFRQADVILNFGNWSEKEIHGDKLDVNPKMMTWSGDNQETMKRIEEYLQGK